MDRGCWLCHYYSNTSAVATLTPAHRTGHSRQCAKQRVLACLTKLSDCDTHSLATTEDEFISRSLNPPTMTAFLSSMFLQHNSRPQDTYCFSSFANPLLEVLFIEQDANTQIEAVLCPGVAIERALDLDSTRLMKLLPKFEKLLKHRDRFTVKPVLRNLVPCLMKLLCSEEGHGGHKAFLVACFR